ncbi:hypothetical protein PN473_01890, partial [Dolichospermum circinale CS-545/17]|nr:hypothetical protein [Dolichospermum circinale CS-545/17]
FGLSSPRSLALPGNAHRRQSLHYISLVPWLCRGMLTGGRASIIFTVFEAEPQTPIPSRSLGTSSGLTGCLIVIE